MVSHHSDDPQWPVEETEKEASPEHPRLIPDPWLDESEHGKSPKASWLSQAPDSTETRKAYVDLGKWGKAERITAIICITFILMMIIIGVLG
jgi:hypothetical protein